MLFLEPQKKDLTLDDVRRILGETPQGAAHAPSRRLRGADVAAFFGGLNESEKLELFTYIHDRDKALAADLLSYLSAHTERDLIAALPPEAVASLVPELSDDDAVAAFSSLAEERAEEILRLLPRQQADRVRKLLRYPPDSAGRRMIPEFVALPGETRAQEAIEHLRGLKEEREMVYYLYVTDENGRLRGVLSMRRLLMAAPNARLSDIMSADVVKASAWDDQEEAARKVKQYGLMALPVVDRDDVLIGIITVDDVMDVVEEEATEDIMRMAGTSEDALLARSASHGIRHRLPWLIATFGGGLGISFLIGRFESVLDKVTIAAAFMPIIAGMGGNVGTQSATIVIRGLALGHVSVSKGRSVLWRELRVSGTLGLFYGALLAVFTHVLGVPHPMLGGVVGASLCISILLAGLLGAIFPLLFSRLGVDPAVATGPFVTTVVDFLSNTTYFLLLTAFILR